MSKGGHDDPSAMRSTTFAVSVLRCKRTGDVLFLEAGKDFVDTIFSFLLLPVGTILHMLSNGPVQMSKPWGGISSIYESVKNLNSSLLHVDKQTLLEPQPAAIGTCKSIGLLQGALEAEITGSSPLQKQKVELPKVYHRCSSGYCTTLSTKSGIRCETCFNTWYRKSGSDCNYNYSVPMSVRPEDLQEAEAAIVKTSCSSGQGFVQANIIYIVTDSLEIMPSTTIRCIKMLNKLKVPSLADLESSDITVTITQVLQLLQSALTSKRCLNDVFGRNNLQGSHRFE